jgi:methionine synthase II (cobalamin-independent)
VSDDEAPVVSVTGIGSWPGEDPLEAQRTVLGELSDGGDIRDVPHLVELPARGPGADVIGRSAARLVDLPVDLQPSGWRLTDAPGRDQHRAEAFWRSDLDALAEAADGYAGPLKVQLAGPWTLAASVWLPRGERAVTDPGARRDLVASLAEGAAAHVLEVRRLVPGAEVVLQLDEPSLPAVHAGRLPTVSGFGRLPGVEASELEAGLEQVLWAATAAGAVETAVHCCATGVPFPVLRGSGASGVALDLSLLGARTWESVAVAVEFGQRLWAGVVPTSGSLPSTAAAVDSVVAPWRRVGLPVADLARVTVTPACGLAGSSPDQARAVLARTVETARALAEVAAAA